MERALDRQVAGNHYKDFEIQPVEFCQRNGLHACESSVVKYVCRHRAKNGAEDLHKAMHYLALLLEIEYGEKPRQEPRAEAPLWFGESKPLPKSGDFYPIG